MRDRISRAVIDQIALADRALAVADAIGGANQEERHFSGLLYHLMTTQADAIVLALSRLFDPPPNRFPTRSIPGLLQFLGEHADRIPVYERNGLENFLRIPDMEPTQLEVPALTREFVRRYELRLSEGGLSDPEHPPAALARIRARRDKQIAHNEDWRPAVNEVVSWRDLRDILDEAKHFAGLVGPAYMDMLFSTSSGTYMVSKSSRMVGVQMERLYTSAAKWIAQALAD